MIIQTFSTPVGMTALNYDIEVLKKDIEQLSFKKHPEGLDQSYNSFLHRDKDYISLSNIIIKECREFNTKIGNKDVPLKITQMWANRYKKGSSIHRHIHNNSYLSGVIYVDGNEEDLTRFYNPSFNLTNFISIPKENTTPFNSNNFNVKSTKGSIVIFPSWLEHDTAKITSDQRYTLSFNIIPVELGAENTLDYVKIG